MPLFDDTLNDHALVTPTSSMTSMTSTASEGPHSIFKLSFISWRVLGAIFAAALVVGWVFIIVILIQEEKWQLVLVAWLLLYAAAHFCYWYFKRHHLLSLHSHICGQTATDVSTIGSIEKTQDSPPTYDDVMRSEPPPPTYYSVVDEVPKTSHKSIFGAKFQRFQWQGLPKVFGKSSSNPGTEALASGSATPSPLESNSCLKVPEGPSTIQPNHSTISIIQTPVRYPSGRKVVPYNGLEILDSVHPPPYSRNYVDIESQVNVPSVIQERSNRNYVDIESQVHAASINQETSPSSSISDSGSQRQDTSTDPQSSLSETSNSSCLSTTSDSKNTTGLINSTFELSRRNSSHSFPNSVTLEMETSS